MTFVFWNQNEIYNFLHVSKLTQPASLLFLIHINAYITYHITDNEIIFQHLEERVRKQCGG